MSNFLLINGESFYHTRFKIIQKLKNVIRQAFSAGECPWAQRIIKDKLRKAPPMLTWNLIN